MMLAWKKAGYMHAIHRHSEDSIRGGLRFLGVQLAEVLIQLAPFSTGYGVLLVEVNM